MKWIQTKFIVDVTWSMASAFIMGLSGILLNSIITKVYGANGLGHYAIAFGCYILLHHISNLGVRHSVSKYVAEYSDQPFEQRGILSSALTLNLLLGVSIVCLALVLLPHLGIDEELETLLRYFFYSIPLASLNKTFFGFLNGLRRMRMLSVMNSLRFGLLLGISSAIALSGQPLSSTILAFVLTEILVSCILIPLLWKEMSFKVPSSWFRRHIHFGWNILLTEIGIELNTRADIFILGSLSTPKAVGIYVFAADLAKGISQLAYMVQINFNPIVARLWSLGEKEALLSQMKRIRKVLYPTYALIGCFLIPSYAFLTGKYFTEVDSWENMLSFIILFGSILLTSGYLPFLAVLSSAGFPRDEMKVQWCVLLANVTSNIILVPFLGAIGSAISTALCLPLTLFIINHFSREKMALLVFPKVGNRL